MISRQAYVRISNPQKDRILSKSSSNCGDNLVSFNNDCQHSTSPRTRSNFKVERVVTGCPYSDTERSGDEGEDDGNEESDEVDEWSGQDDNLEAMVVQALQGDLALAAQMIPVLHKMYYIKFQTIIKQKIGPWRNGITKCSGGPEDGGGESCSPDQLNQSNPRKRQRRPGNNNQERGRNDDDPNEDGDDENGDSKETGDPAANSTPAQNPYLACPFHKFDPAKYSTQYSSSEIPEEKLNYYRSCAGPGSTSIQRLKYI